MDTSLPEQVYFVYMLSCSDGTLYTGMTLDVERRVKEHNLSPKGAKYTRTRRPVQLVYTYSYTSRSAAQVEEARIKKLSRHAKLALIERRRHE